MGSAPSRKILCESIEPTESKHNSFGRLKTFFKADRLVRDELCEKVQCSLYVTKPELCDSVSLLQKPPQSLQQENVRSIL